MMLRLQRERMSGSLIPSAKEYFRYYGLDAEKLKLAKPDALVMHPGPMNRGVEISTDVADGAQSLIKEQVEMGVAVRMAVLEALAGSMRNEVTSPSSTPECSPPLAVRPRGRTLLIDPATGADGRYRRRRPVGRAARPSARRRGRP